MRSYPLFAAVLNEVETFGPVSVPVIARKLGLPPQIVGYVCRRLSEMRPKQVRRLRGRGVPKATWRLASERV